MRLLVALTCLLAGCLAQRPQPCTTPPLLTGEFIVAAQKGEVTPIHMQYLYDAVGQRIRLTEKSSNANKNSVRDFLLHYKEGVVYNIFNSNQTCQTLPLKGQFQPIGIQKPAFHVGDAFLGGSSVLNETLQITTWTIALPGKAGKFITTVTKFGCFPISTSFDTDTDIFGWVIINYFNNVVGITDPSLLNPPSFCPQAEIKPEAEQKHFLNLLFQKD
ncbi:ependymin-1-like [Anabas testudineus]|uniref:Uncharacterized protein n=1 Tax=Anabas testudineus TaxID=64144 RepID=A0A7N6AH62_ANATE|nr:ependymin-1-like [Anabas testudineus]